MSRPSRIHERLASSSRRPLDSATALAMGPPRPGGSRTTKSDSARRARAASRPSRSATTPGRSVFARRPPGQIEQEQVHRATGQQAPGDGQALVEGLGRDDHEPFEPDAASHGLDRIERPGKVQPGHHRAGHLGLGHEPERQGGPSARTVATDGDARGSRQASWSQDGIEAREPGGDDPVVGAGCGP